MSGRTPGQSVKLVIGNTDGKGKNIEVVNTRDLEIYRIPDNPYDDPIEIIVCYAGQRDQAALRYYNILIKPTNEKYEHILNSINIQLQQNNLDTNTIDNLVAQMATLQKERDAALEKLQEQAQFIADINQDQASDLVRSVIQKIE